MKFLIIFFLLISTVWAEDRFDVKTILADNLKDKNNIEWIQIEKEEVLKDGKVIGEKVKDYAGYEREKFSTELNAEGYYRTLAKPNIKEDKLLTVEESKQVKLALWNEGLVDITNKKIKEGRKLIFIQAKPAKNDYKHDFDRGTLYYTSNLKNYSFSKVIIPDGTIIKNSNFTQRKPDTDAIQGEDLTFIDCNLVNIKRHASWILQGSNNTQIKREIKKQIDKGDGNTELTISHKVKEDKPNGQFVEVAEDVETINNDELDNSLLYFTP